MGKPSNALSELDRINSWAKNTALDRTHTLDGLDTQKSARRLSPLESSSKAPNAPLGPPVSLIQHDGSNEKDSTTQSSLSANDASGNPATAKTEKDELGNTAIGEGESPGWPARMRAGSRRFLTHTKSAICHSWINVLLVFVPVGIAMNWAPLPGTTKPTVVFALNAIAIIPLAGLLSHATESVASRMGDTWASLLNVTFGNAVELIIFIIALAKNEIRIVQASILGSILANLLLILGMAFLLGGLRYREQIYNNTVTQMSACLLSLSVTSLLLPTAFHASFSSQVDADRRTTKISRGTSVVLLLVYVLYLLFQLKSHAYMYESTPQQIIDEESHPGVLADMLGSSSSDDSSSTSSSDTDSSSGSQTTANRIKRAFRNRKHRKSSVSSNQSPSIPSTIESASLDKMSPTDEKASPKHAYFEHNRDDVLTPGAILSGDEADTDGERDRPDMPVIRDFQAERGGNSSYPPSQTAQTKSPERKRKKKSKGKSSGKRNDRNTKEAAAADLTTQEPTVSAARVEFSDNVQAIPANDASRRASGLNPFSVVAIPKVFTNTVFSTPSPQALGSANQSDHVDARMGSSLRRTTSLPDRLNKPQQGNRSQVHHSNTEPYVAINAFAINEIDAIAKDKDGEGEVSMSRTAAVMLLLVSTGLVAFCAELLVDSIPAMIADTSVSQAFIGLIILPIVGNAAEHVTAVTVAAKNKMDLAIGVAVGSSIQIALFVTPFVVLLGWIMDKEMSLYFNLFETVSLFVTAFVVNFLVLDGRSNYLEGSLLMAAYVIIAVAAFFYPNTSEQSLLGGGNGPN